MTMTLGDIARDISDVRGESSKDPIVHDIYEPYFSPLRDRPLTILELGVLEGEHETAVRLRIDVRYREVAGVKIKTS